MSKQLYQGISKSFLFDKKYQILRHLLFWIFIYLDEISNLLGFVNWEAPDLLLLYVFLLDLFMVYFNIYFLLPKLLFRKKIFLYATSTILLLAFVVFVSIALSDYFYPMTQDEISEYSYFGHFINYFILQLGILFPAIAIKLFKRNWYSSEQIKELNKLQYESELDKLKKQVNPHFLFNSLNAIYVQAKQKSPKVPESIMALSELMRYQTYDVLQEKVALQKELDFIKNYLEMEQMRRDNFSYSINNLNANLNFKIEPLLILPLVENSCKYSQQIDSTKDVSYVKIDLDQQDNLLVIKIENNIGNAVKHEEKEDKYSGLGQSNVKQRLALLYPDKYIFDTKHEASKYLVKLSISTS